MTSLLELREKLIRFYGKNEVLIKPIIKFIVSFAIFFTINKYIGYMSRISKISVVLILSLISAVMPAGIMIFLAAAVILANLFALSLEVCIVALVLFLLIFLLYFRFAPKSEYDMCLMPLCFQMGIPQVMPLAMGLVRGVYSVFSIICGTVLYFFLQGVYQNAATLGAASEVGEDTASKIVVLINQLLGNKEMYLVLGIFFVTVLIVYLIRRMSIENAWTIAIISGTLFEAIGLTAGYILMEIQGKIILTLIGSGISCLIAFLLQFLFFNLDYSRTERLQFEDDEYYYYVKAVPKAIVSKTEKKVKCFTGKEEHLTKKQFAEELDIDEELLD